MADTSSFRTGLNIIWNDDIWEITDFQHVKPGKGGAFVRTKLRNVQDGRVLDNTFRAGAEIDIVRVERRPHQFLYEDDYGLHFMNTETYEQTTLPPDKISGREFIKEGSVVDVLWYTEEEKPLATELSTNVDLEVVDTDPGVRGDTATGGSKPATLESGAVVSVPLFIEEGDVIRVNTNTSEYVTRVSTNN